MIPPLIQTLIAVALGLPLFGAVVAVVASAVLLAFVPEDFEE